MNEIALGIFEGSEGWVKMPFYGLKAHHVTMEKIGELFVMTTKCGSLIRTKNAPFNAGTFQRCKKCLGVSNGDA